MSRKLSSGYLLCDEASLTPVSMQESESGFEIVTQIADTGKRPASHL
jgi:hypothetical protein